MSDGGDGCAGAADGAACGSGLICVGGACVESACGDGVLDEAAGEQCDDGNEVAFDGCEPRTCTFTCEDDGGCDNELECDGVERCEDHACVPGTALAPGDACTQPTGDSGVCRGAECVAPGCGNGAPDDGEDCDDGNEEPGDGCESDCTFTCTEDADCADTSACNGAETCDTTSHACVPGTTMVCADEDECTMDTCEAAMGCHFPLIDEDGDGHAPDTLACGDDCDDADPSVFAGAAEACDGIDNDCNGIEDDGAPTWYVDCDGDGFAENTTGASAPSCEPPSVPPTGCTSGSAGWTSLRPVAGTSESVDCNDGNGDVFPGQTAYFTDPIPGADPDLRYDYDCSGSHSRQYSCAFACAPGSCQWGFLDESDANPNGCEYLCISGRICFRRPPDCGETALYGRCSCGIITRPFDRTQGCR